MKFRMIIFILVFVAVIAGCTNGGKSENKITLDNVTQALETQGLKLLQIHPKGGNSPFEELNSVAAVTYAIDTNKMNKSDTDTIDPSIVNVYIYVFDNKQAQIEGRKEFDEKSAFAKLISQPSVYEKDNVLIVHFKLPDEKAEYDDMIKTAIQKL